jgi:hypothetical protein
MHDLGARLAEAADPGRRVRPRSRSGGGPPGGPGPAPPPGRGCGACPGGGGGPGRDRPRRRPGGADRRPSGPGPVAAPALAGAPGRRVAGGGAGRGAAGPGGGRDPRRGGGRALAAGRLPQHLPPRRERPPGRRRLLHPRLVLVRLPRAAVLAGERHLRPRVAGDHGAGRRRAGRRAPPDRRDRPGSGHRRPGPPGVAGEGAGGDGHGRHQGRARAFLRCLRGQDRLPGAGGRRGCRRPPGRPGAGAGRPVPGPGRRLPADRSGAGRRPDHHPGREGGGAGRVAGPGGLLPGRGGAGSRRVLRVRRRRAPAGDRRRGHPRPSAALLVVLVRPGRDDAAAAGPRWRIQVRPDGAGRGRRHPGRGARP